MALQPATNQPTKAEQETKSRLLQEISEELELDVEYFIALVTSTIVATFGLLLNNIAIVIGAMLVTPLFWPILGIAMGIITHRRGILSKSLVSLSVSLVVVIALSVAGGLLTPFVRLPAEVIARSEPTVLDLIIALTISVVGVAALRYKKISASTTGVAISLSLLPALTVVGIGLSAGRFDVAGGAALLFAANTLAIIFAGALTLLVLGVKPQYKEEQARLRWGLGLSLLAIIVMAVPLSWVFVNTVDQSRQMLAAERIFKSELAKIAPDANTNGFDIQVEEESINIATTIYIPEGRRLSLEQREQLLVSVQNHLNKKVDLSLDLVSVLDLKSQEAIVMEPEETQPDLTILANQYLTQDWPELRLVGAIRLSDSQGFRLTVAVPEDFSAQAELATGSAQALGFEPGSPDFDLVVIPYQN